MAAAAYTHPLYEMELSDLLQQAEFVQAMTESPGWRLVLECIAAHEQKMLARLLNETTKAEEIPRLRGLISGLASAREAADSILETARSRESEAKRALAAQEPQHV